MENVSYKKAVKLLNGMCQGLGDAFRDNTDPLAEIDSPMSLSGWIWNAFVCDMAPEGSVNWIEIKNLITELEQGAGIKQD